MANKEIMWAINEKGMFYVDEECIDCDACRTDAPGFFIRNDDHETGHSYVVRQPETEEEIAMCEAALEGCPVEAIGNDGTATA